MGCNGLTGCFGFGFFFGALEFSAFGFEARSEWTLGFRPGKSRESCMQFRILLCSAHAAASSTNHAPATIPRSQSKTERPERELCEATRPRSIQCGLKPQGPHVESEQALLNSERIEKVAPNSNREERNCIRVHVHVSV